MKKNRISRPTEETALSRINRSYREVKQVEILEPFEVPYTNSHNQRFIIRTAHVTKRVQNL